MSDVFQIKSESYFGMSKISIELQPTLSPDYMPVKVGRVCGRKVANIQPRLPSGASSISVSDDFGDVFGIYYALTPMRDILTTTCVIGRKRSRRSYLLYRVYRRSTYSVNRHKLST